jgi:integrase
VTEQELIKIIKHTKQKHHKVAFMLGFYEGMRITEVTKLQPEDVDWGQRMIRIKESKNKKDRNIPIAPQCVKVLKQLPVNVSQRALQYAFTGAVKRSKITKDLHFHSLRHGGATHYLNTKKWNIRQVQVFLGHASINSTQIYTHIQPQELIDKMWEGNT